MSDYVIKGQTSEEDGRLVVIDETDWSVEIDESPVPNFVSKNGSYYVEVTDSKKLVFVRKTDGEVKSYGNVDPVIFWDEKTDDTFWQDDGNYSPNFSWTGTTWTALNDGGSASYAALKVKTLSTWAENYRPQFAKVTYTLDVDTNVEDMQFLGCCGRDTTSSTSSAVEEVTSGEGILMYPLWEGKDDIVNLNIKIPANNLLTITGIYFSKDHYNDYVCDGYSYSQNAFDNAVAATGSEPDFTADLEIAGFIKYTENSGTSYLYNAMEFTTTSTNTLSITVNSSGPSARPKVSVFQDRDTQLIGDDTSGTGWEYSGEQEVSFEWSPPVAGTYAVMVKSEGEVLETPCDTFTVTMSGAGGGEEPPADGWTDVTSDFYWGNSNSATDGSWNGSAWDAANGSGDDRVRVFSYDGTNSGAWAEGKKPTKIRVTYTGATSLYLELEPNNAQGWSQSNYVSGTEATISDWPEPKVIEKFMALDSGSTDGFQITKIELMLEDAACGHADANTAINNASEGKSYYDFWGSTYAGIGEYGASSSSGHHALLGNNHEFEIYANNTPGFFDLHIYDEGGSVVDSVIGLSNTADPATGYVDLPKYGGFTVVIYNQDTDECVNYDITIRGYGGV